MVGKGVLRDVPAALAILPAQGTAATRTHLGAALGFLGCILDGKEHFWGRSGSAGRALADGQPSCTALLSWMSCACWNYLLHWSINTLGTGLYFMSTTLSMCLLLYFKSINNSGAAAEIKTKHTQRFTSRIFQHRKEGGKKTTPGLCPSLKPCSCLSWVPLALLLLPAEGIFGWEGDVGSGKPPALPTSPRVWGHRARLVPPFQSPPWHIPPAISAATPLFVFLAEGNIQQHVLQPPGCLFSLKMQ